jgi:hypothetical protein
MEKVFHWASQMILKNSRYTQPYGTCLCYKVCVQVQVVSQLRECGRGRGCSIKQRGHSPSPVQLVPMKTRVMTPSELSLQHKRPP